MREKSSHPNESHVSPPPASPKIIFVSRKWPPAVGGMETYAIRLTERLDGLATLTKIVLPGRPGGAPPSGVALLRFGISAFWQVLTRNRDADVLHIGDMASWPVALAARLTGRKRHIVLSAHGTDVFFPRRGTLVGKAYALYLRLGARLLGRPPVVANSETTASEARVYGFPQTTVVPLATDLGPQQVAVTPDKLLFSGRITPLKGLRWFVETVLDRLPETVSLDVAGTIWDTEEAKVLDHPRVTHLGPLPQSELARAYAGAMAVVVPNIDVPSGQREGFGLVAVEAAASGGVVLAAAHGGLQEAVRDGETGFLLPSGKAEDWIDQITTVRNWSDEERARFVERSTETAARAYSWDRVARDTLAAYGEGT